MQLTRVFMEAKMVGVVVTVVNRVSKSYHVLCFEKMNHHLLVVLTHQKSADLRSAPFA